jgi:uncharacterized integral membrane protein
MRLRRKLDTKELRETWQPKLWLILVLLTLLVAYVVAFVVENNKQVNVHFVLGTARVSVIWVVLLSLAIGVLAGLFLSQIYRRRSRLRARPPGV